MAGRARLADLEPADHRLHCVQRHHPSRLQPLPATGYQVADLSVVYPVARGTGPMLSSLGAFLLLGEAPTPQRVLGLLTVVAGIGLISTQGNLAAFRQPGGQAGVRWGMATGSLIAGYTVVDAYGVKTLGIQPVVLDWCANLLRFVLLAPIVLSTRREPRSG